MMAAMRSSLAPSRAPGAEFIASRRHSDLAARSREQQPFEVMADRAADAVAAGRLVPHYGRPAGCGARAIARHGVGAVMDVETRRAMESGFGADFSQVRIHADGTAAEAAHRLGALAFADGEHVMFNRGQYRPRVPEGRHLLAHELAHVLQQRDGAPQRQCQLAPVDPLQYLRTRFTITPPPAPVTLAQVQQFVQTAISSGKLASATTLGVAPGSEQEIMLLYDLAVWGNTSRWGSEIDLLAPIGFPPAGGAAPVGKVTLRIDAAGKGVAELISAGAVAIPAAHATRADAETALRTGFAIREVRDTGKTWTPEELNIVLAAFARLPPSNVAALKGAVLERVPSIAGGLAGQFSWKEQLRVTTATRTAILRLADNAFAGRNTNFVGGASKEAPEAFFTILHEVGHAVETQAVRDTALERNKAGAELNALTRRRAAGPAVAAARAKFTSLGTKATAATARPMLLDRAKAAGLTAVAALDGAKAAVNSGTPDNQAFRAAARRAGAALAAFAAAVEQQARNIGTRRSAAVAAVTAAETAQGTLQVLHAADPRLAIYAPVVVGQRAWLDALELVVSAGGRSKRLQEFVDFVNANNITRLTKYAADNWLAKPDEFFAEAYTLFLNDPDYLQANSPVLYDWFNAPNRWTP